MSPATAAAQQWRALAPALAARGRMRVSHDGGRTYPRRLDQVLAVDPPNCPAAVYVYGESGETRFLLADFDTKRAAARGAADPVAQVAEDAAALAALVRSNGGRGFGDISPNGGRHAYVPWSAGIPFTEMRRVALALARRYVSLDPSPMLGREHGILRPPGSRHRTGGFQVLTTALELAVRAVSEPNGPEVWGRLLDALSEDLTAVERGESCLPQPVEADRPQSGPQRLDEAGLPWLPRAGGSVRRLRPDIEVTAITGSYDTARYGSPSEARMSVLTSAAGRGWRLADVAGRMKDGTWDGQAGFYGRYRPGAQRAEALAADWRKAVAFVGREDPGRESHTRASTHTGGSPPPAPPPDLVELTHRDYQQIRRWDSAVRAVECQRWTGPHGITVRLVLRALGAAAQLSGGPVIEFGVRSLSLLAGLDYSTVARVLRELREEADPFVDLLQSRRRSRADMYLLRIPESCAAAAAWRRWRPGRIGVHPVFRVLGGPATFVHEQLAAEHVRALDLPSLTGLSPTAVSAALSALAEYGLAERGPGGWRRGPADLDAVSAVLGVPDQLAGLQARYRAERADWRAFLGIGLQPGANRADASGRSAHSIPAVVSGPHVVLAARAPPVPVG